MGENDQDPLKKNRKTADIHIATFNTRSLRTPERLHELEMAILELKWDIIGISEMRRYGETINDYGNYILHHIGETPGLYGVGFLIKKDLTDRIIEIKGVTERIAILNIALPVNKEEKWSIIQAYSPPESSNKEDIAKIEKFYLDLQETIQNAHKQIIVMGDFNGQIGKCNSPGEEYTIGKYAHGKRTKNGARLVSFALQNKLSILNSFFKKKKSKKWTWISPNGVYKNEIDFILSNNIKTFKNVSIVQNLNFNSDHRMVRATLTGRHIQKNRRWQSDSSALMCTGNSDMLTNKLTSLVGIFKEKSTSIEERYGKILNELKTETRKANKKVISMETQHLLEERRKLIHSKESNQKERNKITEVSKKINESIRKDRKIKRQETLEKHIKRTGGVKKAIKELNDKKEWLLTVKTKNKTHTRKRPEIIKVATDYYRELYKSKNPIITTEEQYPLNSEPIPKILKEETAKAINTQKIDKSPGSDQITNELLKSTLPVIAPILTDLFNEIIETEIIPQDWTKSTIILLHKKGDKEEIGNYRPISLMSNIYKVFSKIILSRITRALDENQPREQAGFRSKFSTIDHIHVLRQVLQKYNEYNKIYFLGFVDYNKAFDSLEHEYIWEALREQNIQDRYIRILKNIYSKGTAQVRLEKSGEEFPIERGVRQGDPISPKLFSAALERIIRNLEWKDQGLNINGENLSHLRFADDLILFSECPRKLQQMLQQLSDQSAVAGLTMNITKTKIMTNSSKTQKITVNMQEIEYVEEYIYLGQLISPTKTMHKEIDRRIANTWKRYWSLSEVMKDKGMPIKAKRKVYNMCILPCLTYGCQTWALTEIMTNKINVCQNSIERSVIGVKRKEKVRLTEIKNKTQFKQANSLHRTLKWQWTGHMLREKQEKWTKIVTEWYPRDGKRNKGRQTKRWEDDIKKVAGPEWSRIAKDRQKWRSLEEAYVERQAVFVPNVDISS